MLALAGGFASANDIQLNAGMITSDAANPYGHMFVHDMGTFTDTIDFTIPSGSLGSSANALTLTLGNTTVFNVSNLMYSVYSGTAMDGGQLWATYAGDNMTHDLPLSMAGAYHIMITGNADGMMGGSYALSLVSSVPEPETYAMMFGGLALLGAVARRRQNRG